MKRDEGMKVCSRENRQKKIFIVFGKVKEMDTAFD
jgi:hypothetical protein